MTIGGTDVVNCGPTHLTLIKNTFAHEVTGTGAGGTRGNNNTIPDSVIDLMPVSDILVDPLARDIIGFGTADVSGIQIQITFSATLGTVGNVTLSSWRESIEQVLGTYPTIKVYPQSFSNTGEHTVDTLPRSSTSSALAIIATDSISAGSGNMTHGAVTVNGSNLMNKTSRFNLARLMNSNGWELDIRTFVYLFTDGSLTSYIPLRDVSNFRLTTTFDSEPQGNSYNLVAINLENL